MHARVKWQLLPGQLLLDFSRMIASNVIYLAEDTTRAISRNSETPKFFAHLLTLFNFPLYLGALLFEFSRAIISYAIYLT